MKCWRGWDTRSIPLEGFHLLHIKELLKMNKEQDRTESEEQKIILKVNMNRKMNQQKVKQRKKECKHNGKKKEFINI